MTKKEQEPRKENTERDQKSENRSYDPQITSEDKEVLNNQSEDESKGDYFKDREEPIDYEGEDLDLPEFDDEQFNSTTNKPDPSERAERPKESADTLADERSESETVYKGEKAEKYKDPSEKTRKNSGDSGK